MTTNHDALRRAAILVTALDHRSADALLDQMPPDQAARVRRAVMELRQVDDEEQQRVIQKFVNTDSSVENKSLDGVELEISQAEPPAATTQKRHEPNASQPADEATPLHYLRQADGERLTELLLHEHPQTITVVLSQLPPARASELLLCFPAELQTEILRRIAALGETDPEIVREIQYEIDAKLSDQSALKRMPAAGIATLRAILAETHQESRQRLVAALAQRDRQLAEQLGCAPVGDGAGSSSQSFRTQVLPAVDRPKQGGDSSPLARGVPAGHADEPVSMRQPDHGVAPSTVRQPWAELTFAELARMDNRCLATIFSQAVPETAIIALTGADDDLVDRVLGQLPSRQARRLERQMCQLGPIRLRDVEHAQQQLAKLAENLYRQGIIQPTTGAGFLTMMA